MKTGSSDKIVSYPWHSYSPSKMRIFGVGCFIFAIAAIGFLFFSEDIIQTILSVLLAFLFALGGFGCFHEGKTVVNFSKRTLSHEIYLLNLPWLRKTHFSLEEFSGVYIDQRLTESTYVGLLFQSGKKLLISYFQNPQEGVPSARAHDFANRLSDDFKLPVKNVG